jgi:choline kinase
MLTPPTVQRGVILAAGNGDRFHNGSPRSKLLTPLAGTPLILRTIWASARAGIQELDLVVGYDAGTVRSVIEAGAPAGIEVHFHYNDRWHEENGFSALVAAPHVGDKRFALLMGDHVFDWRVLRKLLLTPARPGESLLAIDRGPISPARAAEATRVRLSADRIVAIGKNLDPFDAVDTGLFVCDTPLFTALQESCAAGDTSLSGGIRRLAARGLVLGIDTGHRAWYDIDTVDDFVEAQLALEGQSPHP